MIPQPIKEEQVEAFPNAFMWGDPGGSDIKLLPVPSTPVISQGISPGPTYPWKMATLPPPKSPILLESSMVMEVIVLKDYSRVDLKGRII